MKRLLLLAICFIFGISVFTACSKSNSDAVTSSNQSQNTAQQEQTDGMLSGEALNDVINNAKKMYGKGMYGVMFLYDTTGDYTQYEENSFDVYCYFDFNVYEEPAPVAAVTVHDYKSGDVIGSFTVQFGSDDSWSAGGAEIFGAYCTSIAHSKTDKFPDVIEIGGKAEDDKGTFAFSMYVREWGKKWDDVEKQLPDNLPSHYSDWYLPRIEKGEEIPKP